MEGELLYRYSTRTSWHHLIRVSYDALCRQQVYHSYADSRRPYLIIYQDGTEEVCGNAVNSSARTGYNRVSLDTRQISLPRTLVV